MASVIKFSELYFYARKLEGAIHRIEGFFHKEIMEKYRRRNYPPNRKPRATDWEYVVKNSTDPVYVNLYKDLLELRALFTALMNMYYVEYEDPQNHDDLDYGHLEVEVAVILQNLVQDNPDIIEEVMNIIKNLNINSTDEVIASELTTVIKESGVFDTEAGEIIDELTEIIQDFFDDAKVDEKVDTIELEGATDSAIDISSIAGISIGEDSAYDQTSAQELFDIIMNNTYVQQEDISSNESDAVIDKQDPEPDPEP